jgi:hypothetical protein
MPVSLSPSANRSTSAWLRNGSRATCSTNEYLGLISISSRHTRRASPASKRDGKEGAREIGLRTELNAFPEQRRGGFEIAGDQIGGSEKVDVLMLNRIEPDGLLDVGNGREGLAAKDIDDAELVVCVSVVWIEIHPRGRLGGGSARSFFHRKTTAALQCTKATCGLFCKAKPIFCSAYSSDRLQSSVQWFCQFRT